MTDAYTVLARCYDRLTADVGYETWADYVERHFRRSKRPVRTVVELGCGTGSLTMLLALLSGPAPLAGPALDDFPELLHAPDGPVYRVHITPEGGDGHG